MAKLKVVPPVPATPSYELTLTLEELKCIRTALGMTSYTKIKDYDTGYYTKRKVNITSDSFRQLYELVTQTVDRT